MPRQTSTRASLASVASTRYSRVNGMLLEDGTVAEGEDVALISCTEPTNEWFIDSAATKHTTHDKSLPIN